MSTRSLLPPTSTHLKKSSQFKNLWLKSKDNFTFKLKNILRVSLNSGAYAEKYLSRNRTNLFLTWKITSNMHKTHFYDFILPFLSHKGRVLCKSLSKSNFSFLSYKTCFELLNSSFPLQGKNKHMIWYDFQWQKHLSFN